MFLTNNHLAIAMEYAAGGNLYQLVARSGGLPEPDARWYFQQLIFAIDYCHKMVRSLFLSDSLLFDPLCTRNLVLQCTEAMRSRMKAVGPAGHEWACALLIRASDTVPMARRVLQTGMSNWRTHF